MGKRIHMTAKFIDSRPTPGFRQAGLNALARALCPDVFALNEECRAALAEAHRLLDAPAAQRERERRREERIAELRAELDSLEKAA